MLKKASQQTAKLIKEKLLDTGIVHLPITAKTISIVFDWFDEEEVSLANAEAAGVDVDEKYFNDVCNATSELLETEEEKVDIVHLNSMIRAFLV